MKRIIIFFLVLISIQSYSQKVEVYKIGGHGVTSHLQLVTKEEKKDKLSVYYYNDWKMARIVLFTGEEIRSYPVKYDLTRNIIEIKTEEEIKLLSIGRVNEIHWTATGEVFYNTMIFDNFDEQGFFTKLHEGKISLLKKPYMKVIESNYVAEFDAGEEEDQYVKRFKYYYVIDNKVREFKKSKRNVLKLFNDNSEQIKDYISSKKLKCNNDIDLIKIFNYYENL